LRKLLKLTVPEEEGQEVPGGGKDASDFNPLDVSFLYKGYAPISIRLVEQALRPAGWSPIAEVCI